MHPVTVLSPHRDDAAFSLFVCLAKWSALRIELRVINFFTESAWAPRAGATHANGVTNIRKREDRHVLSRISSNIRVLDRGFLDAPVRLGITTSQVFEPQTAAFITDDLLDQLSPSVRSSGAGLTLAPLCLGDHVDHLAVREAAVRSHRRATLGFYEDLPYALCTSEKCLRERVKDVERKIGRRLKPVIVRAQAACQKRGVISGYGSQITATDAAAIAEWSRHYGGGERIWIPAHSSRWQFVR